MKLENRNTIAIVGAGAVGTSMLYHLIEKIEQNAGDIKWKIIWFNDKNKFGVGSVYQDELNSCVLNRPAHTMSISNKKLSHFCEWLKYEKKIYYDQENQFLSRSLFGEYLQFCIQQCILKCALLSITLEMIADEVVDLFQQNQLNIITTKNKQQFFANYTILCLGHLKSKRFIAFHQHENFLSNPFPLIKNIKKIPVLAKVGILGSGLTAVDTAITLKKFGHLNIIHLISRSGNIPSVRSQLSLNKINDFEDIGQEFFKIAKKCNLKIFEVVSLFAKYLNIQNLSEYEFIEYLGDKANSVEYLKSQIEIASKGMINWQSLLVALNELIADIWHNLIEEDKKIIMNKYYSIWNSYRVPIPLQSAKEIFTLLQNKEIAILKNFKQIKTSENNTKIYVEFKDQKISNEYDFIIDATGTPRDVMELESPLISSLLYQSYKITFTVVRHRTHFLATC